MWRQLIADPAMLDSTRALMSTIAKVIDQQNQGQQQTESSDDEGEPLINKLFQQQAPRDLQSAPRHEITETPADYIVSVDAPGVAREAIEITYASRLLSIRIVRRPPGPPLRVLKSTVHYGASVLRLGLNRAAAELDDGVKAKLADGVLTVRVPKATAAAVGEGKRVAVE